MTECTIGNADSLSFPKIIATMEEFKKRTYVLVLSQRLLQHK